MYILYIGNTYVEYCVYSVYRFPHGTSQRTELRSTRNFEAHGTSKRTELRSTRNFETHGTSKRTELRNARNFENVFEALMYLIIP